MSSCNLYADIDKSIINQYRIILSTHRYVSWVCLKNDPWEILDEYIWYMGGPQKCQHFYKLIPYICMCARKCRAIFFSQLCFRRKRDVAGFHPIKCENLQTCHIDTGGFAISWNVLQRTFSTYSENLRKNISCFPPERLIWSLTRHGKSEQHSELKILTWFVTLFSKLWMYPTCV